MQECFFDSEAFFERNVPLVYLGPGNLIKEMILTENRMSKITSLCTMYRPPEVDNNSFEVYLKTDCINYNSNEG